MAYVRKTEALVNDITSQVERMCYAAMKPYKSDTLEVGTSEHNDMCKNVVTKTWEAAPHLESRLPHDWCHMPTRVNLRIMSNGHLSAACYLDNCTVNPMRFSPDELFAGSYPTIELSHEDLTGAAKTWFNSLRDNKEKLGEIREKFGSITAQLKSFMHEHASLNTALKEMPELEMYVPVKYITKVHAASEPRRKSGSPNNIEVLNIDREVIASTAISHRILSRTN